MMLETYEWCCFARFIDRKIVTQNVHRYSTRLRLFTGYFETLYTYVDLCKFLESCSQSYHIAGYSFS